MLMSSGSEGEAQRIASGGGALKKGPWSAAEDAVLVEYVKKHGEGNWNAVQRNTGLQRCGKSCRLRWANHLRPNLKKGAFSVDEEKLIIDLHSKLGNKWARISAHLPGRTDNEIKNYWNTRVKRRLRQGLPLYPNNDNINNSIQPSKMLPLQPPTLPLSFHKNAPNNTNNNIHNNTLSLFNPISLTPPLFSLHHPPPFFPSHFLKRCPTTFLGRATSSPVQMSSFQLSSVRFGFESGQVPPTRVVSEGFDFDIPNHFELPSNQLDQNVPIGEVVNEVKGGDTNHANMGRTKSGLLDDLLQEAQAKGGGGRGLKREREEFALQWDISTSENSCNGIKKEKLEDHQLNFVNDDLSNILDLIPSLVQVPEWFNDGGRESSVGQSSVVSTDDNYNGGNEIPDPPPDTGVSTSDYNEDDCDWNPSCYTWDNLPRIC